MLPLIIAAAGAYLIGSSKVSKFAEGGRLEYNREEYDKLLQKYDRVGAFLDDAEDEQEKEKYKKELSEIGDKIYIMERGYADGGILNIGETNKGRKIVGYEVEYQRESDGEYENDIKSFDNKEDAENFAKDKYGYVEYVYEGQYKFAKGGVLNMGVYGFNYRMLDRLRQDNEYYLGYGNRSPKTLWAGSVDGQIAEMIRLYNEIPDNKKPEWINMQDILQYERKMKGSDGVMANGGKIEVVQNEGSGKVINQLYNQWNSIKTKAQHDKWAEKVRNTKFGTYGTISLMEILDRFDFDEAHINSVNKEGFKKEISKALKSQYADGGVMAKGGILLASSPTLDGIKNMIGKYFYSSNISIKQIGDTNEYEVHNAKGNINAFKVIFSKGKYRFEQKETSSYADGGVMAAGGVIATTILSQLGGAGRLHVMTGAYNFVDNGNGLSFKIKNPKANYIKITLNGMDLYDIEIGRIRGDNYKVVKEVENIYFDQMKGIIEEATGMYLSL